MKEKAQKVYCSCMVCFFLCLIVAVFLQRWNYLKEPYFMKNTWEVCMPSKDSYPLSNETVELTYITNADDDSYIKNITFDEEPQIETYTSETEKSYYSLFGTYELPKKIYGSYQIKKSYVTFNYSTIEAPDSPVTLKNAEITMSDGRSFHTSLGNITLQPDLTMVDFTTEDPSTQLTSYFKILCYLKGKGQ